MKLYLPQPAKQEYRLTGIGCSVLNDTAFAAGTRNVAGGHQLKIASFDAAARKLTIAEGEPGKLAAGMALHLWTCADDDNSPYELKIVNVDTEARTVTIDRDLDLKKEQLETAAEWIAAVPDLTREAAAFAAGDLCFATGEYAFASGSLTLASGFGAHAEGILCEARGDMSFAVGSMTRATGETAVATGTNTVASGMFSTATGNSTTASGDSSIAAGSGTEAAADAAVALGFRTKAAGRCALAAGGLAEAKADFSAAIGRQIKTAAKYSMILGVHGELADTVENQGALAFAAGDAKAKRLGLLIQPNRAIRNPLYPQEGEPEYLPEPDFALTVSGHLLPATVTAPGDALTLDHSRAGRWKITPTANVTPVLKNWRDGDRGELVVYNGGSKVLFPAAWHWIGSQPALKSSGVDVFTIFQVDDLVYIRHAEAGGSGGGTSGGSVDESRLLPALDSIPVGRNGNPIVFRAVSEGMDEHTLLYMPCEDYKDHSQYLRTVIQASGNSIAIDVSDKKFGAASLHGNGSNRAGIIAELPVAPFAADTTVHAWVKITDADDRCGIFDTYGAADGGSGDPGKGVGGIALWTHQGKLKAYKASAHFSSYWYDDDSGNLLVEADLPSDYLNRWMHVALVRSGLNWILFVDGVKLAENIKDFTPDKKFIRLAQHQSDAMTGNLDEFIILDYARWITGFELPTQPATTLTRSYEISDKAPLAVEAPADGDLLIGQGGKFVKITLAELKARLNALS